MNETMKMIEILNANKIKQRKSNIEKIKKYKRDLLFTKIFCSVSGVIFFIGLLFFISVVERMTF